MTQVLLFLVFLGCFANSTASSHSSYCPEIGLSQSLAKSWFNDYIEDVSHEQIREVLHINL